MTKEEFWEKWKPCDWPPIAPSKEDKKEFMEDLEKVICNYIKKGTGDEK